MVEIFVHVDKYSNLPSNSLTFPKQSRAWDLWVIHFPFLTHQPTTVLRNTSIHGNVLSHVYIKYQNAFHVSMEHTTLLNRLVCVSCPFSLGMFMLVVEWRELLDIRRKFLKQLYFWYISYWIRTYLINNACSGYIIVFLHVQWALFQ